MSLNDPLTFAAGGADLDRASHLRGEAPELMVQSGARLLPQWHEKTLIDISGQRPELGWVVPEPALVAQANEFPVFLGRYQETPCFTADFTALDEEIAGRLFGASMKFIDLRSVAGQLTQAEVCAPTLTCCLTLGRVLSFQPPGICGHCSVSQSAA